MHLVKCFSRTLAGAGYSPLEKFPKRQSFACPSEVEMLERWFSVQEHQSCEVFFSVPQNHNATFLPLLANSL